MQSFNELLHDNDDLSRSGLNEEEAVDHLMQRFMERCNRDGIPDDWEPYLASAGSQRTELLVALCLHCLELTLRPLGSAPTPPRSWANSECGSARAYLEKFPELTNSCDAPVELNAWELFFRGRCEVDDVDKFDGIHEKVRQRLRSLHADYGKESITNQANLSIPGYELHDVVGQGGMGTVFRAYSLRLNKMVALKVIRSGVLAHDAELRRFTNEAKTGTALDHPGIVPILDVGEHAGQRYFAMKLIEGGNLQDHLKRYFDRPHEAAALLSKVADAVFHAHQRGILHRDLKPANILIDAQSNPIITDFGLAKSAEVDMELTASGTLLGTPAYMAPEQVKGERGSVTIASDIYGLGAVFYAMLTGRPPFLGDSMFDVLEAVQRQTPEALSRINANVPRDLETICLKCLEKESQRRYASCEALAADLRAWLNCRPITARRTGALERIYLWSCRNPQLALLAGVCMAAFISITASVCYMHRSSELERLRLKVAHIRSAKPDDLRRLVRELEPEKTQAIAIIQESLASKNSDPLDPNEAWRYHLAMLEFSHSPQSVDFLVNYLPISRAEELPLIVESLASTRSAVLSAEKRGAALDDLWNILRAEEHEDRRFRSACALARLDPNSVQWTNVLAAVSEWLVRRNTVELSHDVAVLEPVSTRLMPHLLALYGDSQREDAHRSVATNVLIAYIQKSSPEMRAYYQAEMLMNADERRFILLRNKLDQIEPDSVKRLVHMVSTELDYSDEGFDIAARRKANAAICHIYLDPNWFKLVAPLLHESNDLTLRSYLVDRMPWLGDRIGRLQSAVEHGTIEPDVLKAILEALTNCVDGAPNVFPNKFGELYERHTDPGVHAAAGLLLRRRLGPAATRPYDDKLALDEGQRQAARLDLLKHPSWYIARSKSTNGPSPLTLVVIPPPGEVEIAPRNDPSLTRDEQTRQREFARRIRIERSYAIAAFEVTLADFQQYLPNHPHRDIHGPGAGYPVNTVNWYTALGYCQWLNRMHQIPEAEWCFPPDTIFDPEERREKKLPSLELPSDYLHKTGYRLLTEAEWEHACRSGTVTSRYFGPLDLMNRYACTPLNSQSEQMMPAGSFLPNRFGLFDMLGNAMEWTMEPSTKWSPSVAGNGKPLVISDDEFPGQVSEATDRKHVVRGGSFYNPPSRIRASYRYFYQPSAAPENLGFRVGRTIGPSKVD